MKRNKLKNNRGFSLSEMLIVVAILVILMAFIFVGVIQYQKSLKQVEMDGMAKEIFIAAQTHLSSADVQGLVPAGAATEGDTALEIKEVTAADEADADAKEAAKQDSTYFLAHQQGGGDNALLDLLLPWGAIDDTVRTGGNYIIRYEKLTARVRDVFYCDEEAFASITDASSFSTLLKGYADTVGDDGAEVSRKSDRRNYNGKVIGYYGGVGATLDNTQKISNPYLTVYNGDELYATVREPEKDTENPITTKLLVRGVSSKAYVYLDIPTGNEEPIYLDSVTQPGKNFATVIGKNANKVGEFLPGEDILIKAVSYRESEISNISESTFVITNSLFAELEGKTAVISHVRHLQNLDPLVSGLDYSTDPSSPKEVEITGAKLSGDLEYSSGKFTVMGDNASPKNWDGDYSKIYGKDSTAETTTPLSNEFLGIYNPHLTSFDGVNFTIKDMEINGATVPDTEPGNGNAGLFRYVNNTLEVKNVKLEGFVIDSTSGHAGGVAAEVAGSGQLTIRSVLVARDDKGTKDKADDIGKVNATGTSFSAGGLVGIVASNETTGLVVSNSAASVLVEGTATAGGLIGLIASPSKVDLANSYVGGVTNGSMQYDTISYNITSSGVAGGLVGQVSGASALSVSQCFSAGSVNGATAGGIIGKTENASNITKLSTVYTVAPVNGVQAYDLFESDGTTPKSHTITSPSGAFLGAVQQPTVAAAALYYMPEVYEGYLDKEITDVDLIGKDSQWTDLKVDLAFYAKSLNTNLVAAKRNQGTMQSYTVPYDGKLLEDEREYPFSVWTVFAFDKNPAGLYYYGDWQPVTSTSTVIHDVKFRYQEPGTNAFKEFEDNVLTTQTLIANRENRLTLPTMKIKDGEKEVDISRQMTITSGSNTTDYFRQVGWTLYKANGKNVGAKVTDGGKDVIITPEKVKSNESGDDELASYEAYVTLDKKYSLADYFLVATYKTAQEDGNICDVKFINYSYDVDDVFKEMYVDKNGSITLPYLDQAATVGAKSTVYSFLGWSTDPKATEPGMLGNVRMKPGASVKITDNITLYPVYSKQDMVKIRLYFLKYDNTADPIIPNPDGANVTDPYTFELPDNGQPFTIILPTAANYVPQALYAKKDDTVTSYSTDNRLRNVQNGKVELRPEDRKSTWVTPDSEDYLNYVVLYKLGNTSIAKKYTITHLLADTKNDNSYQADTTKTLGTTEYTTTDAVDASYVANHLANFVSNAVPEQYETALQSANISVSGQTITLTYPRKEYTLNFDTLPAEPYDSIQVPYGKPLSQVWADIENPTLEEGIPYSFTGWELTKLGESSPFVTVNTSKTVTPSSTAMPAQTVTAKALWQGQPVGYNVVFWFEKLSSTDPENSKNYSYAGMHTVSSSETGSERNYRVNAGTKVTPSYYVVPNTTRMRDLSYTDENGEKDYFEYNPDIQLNSKTYTLSDDGNTVINVYLKRRVFTLNFYTTSGKITRASKYVLDDDGKRIVESSSYSGLGAAVSANTTVYVSAETQWNYNYNRYVYTFSTYSNNWYNVNNVLFSDKDTQLEGYVGTTSNSSNYNTRYNNRVIYSDGTWYKYTGDTSLRAKATKTTVYQTAQIEPFTAKYGEDITEKWPESCSYEYSSSSGYTYRFTGWYGDGGNTIAFATKRFTLNEEVISQGTRTPTTSNVLNYYCNMTTSTLTEKTVHYWIRKVNSTEYEEKDKQTSSFSGNLGAKAIDGFEDGVRKEGETGNTYNFYYDRKTFHVIFNNGSEQKTDSTAIQYEAPIPTSIFYTPTAPAGYEGYTFGGWYDYDNSQVQSDDYFYKDGNFRSEADSKMPNGPVSLWAYWIPPTYEVTLDANGGKFPDGTTSKTEIVASGKTLFSKDVINETGTTTDAYTPTREGYTLRGWYTQAEGGKFFALSSAIRSNTKVYARWQKNNVSFTAKVTISYYKDEEKPNNLVDTVEEYVTVTSDLVEIAPKKDIPGYNPPTTWKGAVDPDGKTTISFVYTPVQKGKYTIHYIARFQSVNGATQNKIDDTRGLYQLSGKEEVEIAKYTKSFNGGYTLASFDLNDLVKEGHADARYASTYTFVASKFGTSATEGNARANLIGTGDEVYYYITPDTSMATPEDLTILYDGKTHGGQGVAYEDLTTTTLSGPAADGYIYPVPGASGNVEIYFGYEYKRANGKNEDVVDAGAYRANVRLLARVGAGDSAKRYVLWETSPSDKYYIRIAPRTVVMHSTSAIKKYDGLVLMASNTEIEGQDQIDKQRAVIDVWDAKEGTAAHASENIGGVTYTYPAGEGDGFVEGQGATYYFSVDSFRRNTGTTDNIFTYEFWDGSEDGKGKTKAENYTVIKKYGTLKIE